MTPDNDGRSMTRDTLFISHANPQDNEFARWLSLQLAAAGYATWCDVTQLLGGETFWADIEDVIRNRAAKVLFVLSKSSNDRGGTRDELALARAVERSHRLKDFVVPIKLDDMSFDDTNIELQRRIAIAFNKSWAAGLAQLLALLKRENVSLNESFGPTAVNRWWKENSGAKGAVIPEPEAVFTNWYPIEATPLFFHELAQDQIGPLAVSKTPFPAVKFNQYLVSFAPAADFDGVLGPGISISGTIERRLNDTDAGEARLWGYAEERRTISNLLRQAFETTIRANGFPAYEFANGRLAFYFAKGMVPDDRVRFTDVDGRKSWRAVAGKKTIRSSDGAGGLRYWHFALEAKPITSPTIGFAIKPHVLFSDDGFHIWESKEKLHRTRRSHCKNWWNDRWRGLVQAGVGFMAGQEDHVRLIVGSQTTVQMRQIPISLESPVSIAEGVAVTETEGLSDEDSELDLELDEA